MGLLRIFSRNNIAVDDNIAQKIYKTKPNKFQI